MGNSWKPEDELERPTTSVKALDLYNDGWKWCFSHQGWWNPRTWQECPCCFEADKPRNFSDPADAHDQWWYEFESGDKRD